MDIALSPRRILRVLLVIVLTLTLVNAGLLIARYGFGHGNLFGLVRLFDVNLESNVPAYYSALQLGLAALVLYAIGRGKRAAGDRFGTHWLVLSAVFAYLSVDEAALIHEKVVGDFLRGHFPLTGIWYYAWYIVYGSLFAALVALYWRFFWSLPARTRLHFACAGAAFVAGAVGLEMVGSHIFGLTTLDPSVRELDLAVVYSIEEPIEMLAIAWFVYAALDYAAAERITARLSIQPDRDQSAPAGAPLVSQPDVADRTHMRASAAEGLGSPTAE